MSATFRQATIEDMPFILSANHDINAHSHLHEEALEERLKKDLFSTPAKAYVLIVEFNGTPIGLTLYSQTYFANEGAILWVSQTYIAPKYRNRRDRFILQIVHKMKAVAKELDCTHICYAVSNENDVPRKLSFKLGAKALDDFTMFALPVTV